MRQLKYSYFFFCMSLAFIVACTQQSGDLNDSWGTHVRFDSGDGVLVVAEIGFDDFSSKEVRVRTRFEVEERPAAERRVGQFGKYAVGVWGYSGEFDDFVRIDASGDPRTRNGSFGVYALAEQRIFFERDDPFQGLSVYARAGFADKRTDPVDGYVGAGVVYRGLIAGRDGDRLGFGVAAAHLSRDYRKGRRRAGSSSDDWEVALELTYRVQATAWLSIQPDVQYVINPGGGTGLSNAVVVGTRFVVSL